MISRVSRRRVLAAAAVGTASPCWGFAAVAAPARGDVQPIGAGVPAIDAMMCDFMQSNAVCGASLSITRRGRLVHAAGYGRIDPAQATPVKPHHRFRIASVSKPLTAIAILRLCQEDKIQLSDGVTEVLGYRARDPRFSSITIRHLLQHTGGFDRNKSFDPMFRDHEIASAQQVALPVGADAIVDFMLNRELDFTPGTRYAYSNFGYLLLGKVIQQVAGQDYESYIQQQILNPLGECRMRLGRTRRTEAAEDEVRYVADAPGKTYPSVLDDGQVEVAGPYGHFHLEPMAAHGGWLATTTGLVRLAAAVQGFVKPAPLCKASLATMVEAPAHHDPEDAVYYGCGVQVRTLASGKRNIWHNGSLDGTNALWVLRHDGFAWSVLFNQRYGSDRKELVTLIDAPLHQAVDSVRDWPSDDLFGRFL